MPHDVLHAPRGHHGGHAHAQGPGQLLRRRILAELSAVEAARATDLAARLGMPANSLGFHLRVLAEAHIIEDAPELARDKHDRVWLAVPGGPRVGPPSQPRATVDGLALQAYPGAGRRGSNQLRAVVDWGIKYATGSEPEVRAMLDISTLVLNAREAEELEEGVLEPLRRSKERSIAAAGDGTERKLWNFSMVMAREDLPGLR